MYSNPQKRGEALTEDLRREAGSLLRDLREKRGLSQRQLAAAVGTEYYTFISQLETGRGRLPPDKYHVWADALGVPVRDLVVSLMRCYDPVTYDIVFGTGQPAEAVASPDGDRTHATTSSPIDAGIVKLPQRKAGRASAARTVKG